MRRRRILALTSRLPYPIVSGGQARMYHLIKELTREFDVDLFSIHNGSVPSSTDSHLRSFIQNTYFHSSSKTVSVLNAVSQTFLNSKPLQVGYYYRRSIRKWIVENHKQYDLILCFHVRTAEYVRGLERKIVVDLVDAISLGYTRALKKGHSRFWDLIYRFELPRLIKYERGVIADSTLSIVVSAVDKQFLVSQGAMPEKIEIVPHGTELLDVHSSGVRPLENIDVVFHGKMDYPPNEAACFYYVEEVLPLLEWRNTQPNFYIVGFAPSRRVRNLAHGSKVVVTGFVENLADYLAHAKVVVAPLTYGSGVKTKVLEAMGMGKPVVTTTVGADGILGENGVHFFIADTPVDFANRVKELLADSDLRQRMGAAAQSLIKRDFTWEKSGALLRGLLHAKLIE